MQGRHRHQVDDVDPATLLSLTPSITKRYERAANAKSLCGIGFRRQTIENWLGLRNLRSEAARLSGTLAVVCAFGEGYLKIPRTLNAA